MNKTTQPTTRNQTMDFLKGIGIIYVVLGHTLVNPMHNFIYLFHMPLFYFISGYFYKDDYSYKPKQLIISRIKTLYIPFLKYELIFLLMHNFSFKIYLYSDKLNYKGTSEQLYNVHDYIINFLRIITFGESEQLLGAFWFFTVLFTINVLFCFIRFFLLKIEIVKVDLLSGAIISILFITGSILKYSNITLPRQMEVSFMGILIFYIGFLYKKYLHLISINKWIAVICLVILCIGTKYGQNYFYKSLVAVPFVWLLMASAGIYVNIFIAQFQMFKNSSLINFIGNNTIVIMGLHFLSFKLINVIQVLYLNYPLYLIASFPVINGSNGWWIAYSFTGVFVPLLFKLMYINFKKIRFK